MLRTGGGAPQTTLNTKPSHHTAHNTHLASTYSLLLTTPLRVQSGEKARCRKQVRMFQARARTQRLLCTHKTTSQTDSEQHPRTHAHQENKQADSRHTYEATVFDRYTPDDWNRGLSRKDSLASATHTPKAACCAHATNAVLDFVAAALLKYAIAVTERG